MLLLRRILHEIAVNTLGLRHQHYRLRLSDVALALVTLRVEVAAMMVIFLKILCSDIVETGLPQPVTFYQNLHGKYFSVKLQRYTVTVLRYTEAEFSI